MRRSPKKADIEELNRSNGESNYSPIDKMEESSSPLRPGFHSREQSEGGSYSTKKCGHYSHEGNCSLLCDDYVSDTPGLCYLQAFTDRKSAHTALKTFPLVKSLFSYIAGSCDQVGRFAIYGTGDIMHLTLSDGLETENMNFHFFCGSCGLSKSLRGSYYGLQEKMCSSCRVPLDCMILPKTSIMNKKVGWDLSDVASIVADNRVSIDPMFYMKGGIIRKSLKTIRDDDMIIISFPDGREHKLPAKGQKIRAMRHDYVASEYTRDTDTRLEVIGVPLPQGILTPDFIDPVSKVVVELATVLSSNKRSLESAFRGKIVRYQDTCHSVGATLAVLVVGINCVMTNVTLKPWHLQELCSRFLEIHSQEVKVEELCGYSVFRDDLSDDMRTADIALRLASAIKPCKNKFYEVEKILSFCNEPSEKDERMSTKILEKTLKASREQTSSSKDDLLKYLSRFNADNSRSEMKRCCNIPMVYSENGRQHISQVGSDVPSDLRQLWNASAMSRSNVEIVSEADIVNNVENPELHKNKKAAMFRTDLCESDKHSLALRGVGAKQYDGEDFKKEHEANQKKSFHPSTGTDDITHFLAKKFWFEDGDPTYLSQEVRDSVHMSKNLSTGGAPQDSSKLWDMYNRLGVIRMGHMITYLFTELSYNYKHWTSPNSYIRKDLKNGISILIHNPKGHLFVSYSIPKSGSEILETGRIGPELFDSGTHYISDFCSYDEPTIEHFIKAGPYMSSLLVHLISSQESNPTEINRYVKDAIVNIMLLFCNNKTDVEELITSQRYLFMKLLEDVRSSPWDFVDRFPSVFRSRVTVYYFNKTLRLIEYYEANRIIKVPSHHESMMLYDYKGIKSLFSEQEISLHQKVNEFYFGYVISKQRGRGGDRMFKVLSKIIEQEYNFRDKMKDLESIFSPDDSISRYCVNESLMRVFSNRFKRIIESKLGKDFKKVLYSDYLKDAAHSNFNKLATLKASAREHPDDFHTLPSDGLEQMTATQILQQLNKANPDEADKRPKAMEALITIVEQFIAEKGKPPSHLVDLLPWCLHKLQTKGFFDSDCFAKPQHGGDREIHVLKMEARIVQYFLELFSKVVCKYFPSETTVNPETKDHFVRDHYQESKDKLGEYQVHGKSADASKWCQAHHTSHFAAMLAPICPDEIKGFIVTALSLWPNKKLSFPMSLASSLLSSTGVQHLGATYSRFLNDFTYGKEMFSQAMSNKIQIQSGMFQGILHHTSSLYHTMIQEVMKLLIEALFELKLMKRCHVSVIQGSDDSGCLLSIAGKLSPEQMRLARTVLMWKEHVGEYLSVYWNICKSSIGTHDLFEYNSEWFSRHKVIKPTFRWISACMEMTVSERFVDRFRIFNNIVTQCLEGGASTLEMAVVQLNQCAMHYIMLGFNNQAQSRLCVEAMKKNPDPVTGFMPCDFDISAGVTGVEFSLFCLYKFTSYGCTLRDRLSSDAEQSYVPDEALSHQKVKDLTRVKLGFSKMSIFQSLVKKLPLGSYEEALEKVDEQPSLLFTQQTTWEDDKPSLILKVFSPMVKESISNVSPLLRMVASSAYVQTSRCFSVYGEDIKMNLYNIITTVAKKAEEVTKPPQENIFPLSHEFSRVWVMICKISRDRLLQEVVMKKTSKSKIIVFESGQQDYPLIDLCKRRWFGLQGVNLSKAQFERVWVKTQEAHPYLSSLHGEAGLHETRRVLGLNVLQCKNYLESLSTRTRSVVLYDSSSKSRSLPHTISRIYWPNTKIRHADINEDELLKLRSKIFSTVSYWSSSSKKEQMIEEWLRGNKNLEGSLNEIQKRFHKMKIFRDFLVGGDLSEIINKITNLKSGVIGCFVSVQKGYGQERKGLGIWKGQVLGINTEIYMVDSVCTKVVISSTSESIVLGKALRNLITEFHCRVDSSSHEVSLRDDGHFSSHSKGTKVVVDREMTFSYVEDLENARWSIYFSDFNMRLKVSENIDGVIREFTILSDAYTSRDWLPETPIETPDSQLLRWSLGQNMAVSEMSKSTFNYIPHRRAPFMMLMKRISKGEMQGIINFDFLRQALISSFRLNLTTKSKASTPDEEAVDPALINDIYQQVMSINIDDDLMSGIIGSWADEIDRDVDIFMCDVGSNDSDAIDEMIKMLQYGVVNEQFLEDNEPVRAMPNGSRFFASLNNLSVAQVGITFSELVDMCHRNSGYVVNGILGKAVSLILREYHIADETDTDVEIVDLDSDADQLSDTLKAEVDIHKLDLDDLKAKIELIDTMLSTATGNRELMLRNTRTKYSRMYSLVEKKEVETLAVMAPYDQLLRDVCKMIRAHKLLYHDQLPTMEMLHETIIETLIHSRANPTYEAMSDLERVKIQQAINRKTTNVELLNLMSLTFDIRIEIPRDNLTFGLNHNRLIKY